MRDTVISTSGVGTTLRAVRLRAGLTQRALAARIPKEDGTSIPLA